MRFDIAREISDTMEIVSTYFSPTKENLMILVLRKKVLKKSKPMSIYVYLLTESNGEWLMKDILETFNFSNPESAQRFVKDLPSMSALDLLLLKSIN